MMREDEARQAVVDAGVLLVNSGLIARTWGNVSCRISDTHFVITPTGRDYLSLTPEEVVPVAIDDLSHTGDIKPSGERGVHAVIYAARPEVDFVIHTHQAKASAVGTTQIRSFWVPGDIPSLGHTVYCADYGLPGTKKLQKGVGAALRASTGRAIIMRNHGAVCFGRTADEVFQAAIDLEVASEDFIEQKFCDVKRTDVFDAAELRRSALARLAQAYGGKSVKGLARPHRDSDRVGDAVVLHLPDRDITVRLDGQAASATHPGQSATHPGQSATHPGESATYPAELASEVAVHRAIYTKNPQINSVVAADSPDVVTLSRAHMTMRPMVDDFAQIVGTSVHSVFGPAEDVAEALSHAAAVFIVGQGAFCGGANRDDAEAARMILEKNCRSYIWSALLGKPVPIGRLDSLLMRVVYLKKYSLEIDSNV